MSQSTGLTVIMTSREVCNHCKFSMVTLWTYIQNGNFPKPCLTVGKNRRAWTAGVVENWLQERIAKGKQDNAA